MAPVIATTVVKDGNGNAITGGVQTLEFSGNGTTGPFMFINALVDSATGTTLATVKKANTTAVAGDTAVVVGIHPQSNAVVASGTVTANVSGTVTATATLTIGGAVVSSTNGLFTNLLQNNATLTPTNGAWVNVMFNNAIVSAGAGLPVNIVSGTVNVGNVTAALNQGGNAISSTNGIFANVMFNNALVSASVGLPVNIVSGSVSVGNVTAAINQGGAALSSTNGLYTQIIGSTSGGTTVAVKGASITAVAADPSLVVQFNPQSPGIIPTGTFGTPSTTVLSVQGNTSGTPIPVSGPLTLSTTATPTLATTSAYTATQVIGGIITFTGVLGSYTQGLIESITCKFNTGIMTTGLSVALFKASPAAGSYTDHTVAAINTADVPSLIGVYVLSTAYSSLGNHAIYNLDGIAKAFQSATSNVYGVVTSLGTTLELGTLTTFSIELAVIPG